MGRLGCLRRAAGAVAGALCLSACGSADAAAPRRVAMAYAEALADQDGDAACALLTPDARERVEQASDRDCAAGLLREGLPVPGSLRRTEVFGTTAQVRFETDTVFLAEYAEGWRIRAAGCERPASPEEPYDCTVEGG